MSIIPPKLEIPLFFASRNRIKNNRLDQLKKHIAQKTELYTQKCIEDNVRLSASHRRLLEIVGLDKRNVDKSCLSYLKRTEERMVPPNDEGRLPPNLYDATYEPYSRLKGSNGAYWKKLDIEKERAKKPFQDDLFKFYDTPGFLDHWQSRRAYFKGQMCMVDLRKKRPTARCMVDSIELCYRDPDEPGPDHYLVENHEIAYNVCPPTATKVELPFNFYAQTTVPVKENAIHAKKTKFTPGPGRYENRFPKVCICIPDLKYWPDLHIIIDRQKRFKFRRKRWFRVHRRFYCVPNWKHVPGNGHMHLFKIPAKLKREWKKEFDKKKKKNKKNVNLKSLLKPVQMYANAQYLDLINNTSPKIDNNLKYAPEWSPKIKYNTLILSKTKKKAKASKKVGFLSGAKRFDFMEKRPSLTPDQVRQLKENLPLRLRCFNRPVMTKPLSEIKVKLYETKAKTQQVITRPPFTFAPLPETNMLYDANDLKAIKANIKPLYREAMSHDDYYKSDELDA